MKKICIVTATRAEYGYLKWLMKDINENPKLELQLVVTGTHLEENQGYTVKIIEADNIPITKRFRVNVDNSSNLKICETMARYENGFAGIFNELKPDCVVVLGDRYELLPICSVAFMMKIPIVHLCGGDVTEGALDDGIRNAVTMLADYHFPLTIESAKNIIRMRGSDKNVYMFGSTSLDTFNRIELLNRNDLAKELGLDIDSKWVLLTFHSETKESIEYNLLAIKNICNVLNNLDGYQVVVTKSNADLGGLEINGYLEDFAKIHSNKFKIYSTLGQKRYFSFMKQVKRVIGNSSSGILESPFLCIPTVNIGNRQKGRYQCNNVVQSGIEKEQIKIAIDKIITKKIDKSDLNYYGDGNASRKVMKILENA